MNVHIQTFYDTLSDELKCLFDERAAIYEYEGGHERAIAERYAQRHICELLKREKQWQK